MRPEVLILLLKKSKGKGIDRQKISQSRISRGNKMTPSARATFAWSALYFWKWQWFPWNRELRWYKKKNNPGKYSKQQLLSILTKTFRTRSFQEQRIWKHRACLPLDLEIDSCLARLLPSHFFLHQIMVKYDYELGRCTRKQHLYILMMRKEKKTLSCW